MSTKVGIGISTNLDSERAGKTACKQAFQDLEKIKPNFIFVFISTIFDQKLALGGVRSVSKDIPIVGLSTIASITSFGSVTNSVTVCAIASDIFKFTSSIVEGITKYPENKTAALCRELSDKFQNITRHVCVLFSEGLSINSSDILKGAQTTLGTSFPIMGGSSTDDLKFQLTYQYFNDKIFMDSIVGTLIGGNISVGVGRSNAWHPIGGPHRVTRSNDNIIKEIDRKKAYGIYEYYLNKNLLELKVNKIAKLGSVYPLGYKIEDSKEYFTRMPFTISENGSLVLSGELPQDKNVHIMKTDKNFVLEATKSSCLKALKNLDKAKIKFALCFSDISRYQILKKDPQAEVDIIRDVLGKDVPFFGCYTCGEYAPIDQTLYKGRSCFHNNCITITVFAEKMR